MASWEEHARNFLLEEEEEDEELFFVLLPAIMAFLDEEKTPEHTSSLPGAKKVKEILEGHENWCKVEFRMETEIFRTIANFLRTENLLRDTRGMKIEEQLGLFMFMLSYNASTERLKKEFQHSGETVHRKINEFFDIIPALMQKFIRLPNPSRTHVKITCDPRFMPFFQAYAMTIFKLEINREVFMKMKNKNVRLIWLKQQISDLSGGRHGGGNLGGES